MVTVDTFIYRLVILPRFGRLPPDWWGCRYSVPIHVIRQYGTRGKQLPLL